MSKILLYEGIQHKHRQARYDYRNILQLRCRTILFQNRLTTTANRAFRSDQNFLQNQLQRIHGFVLQEDHGVEVAVPLANGVVQGDDTEHSLGQGQNDLQEGLQYAGTVDLRGFLQLTGYTRREKAAGDDQVGGGNGTVDGNHPPGVDEAQRAHQNEAGDQAAAEKHGEDKHLHNKSVAVDLLLGQGIGTGDG